MHERSLLSFACHHVDGWTFVIQQHTQISKRSVRERAPTGGGGAFQDAHQLNSFQVFFSPNCSTQMTLFHVQIFTAIQLAVLEANLLSSDSKSIVSYSIAKREKNWPVSGG